MSKLLIVDDDIRLRKLVRTYGEVEHYECDEAADGLAALEKLKNYKGHANYNDSARRIN